MANRIVFKLRILAAGPIAIGLMNSPQIRAQSQPNKAEFEAASVKPHAPGDNRFIPPRFLAGGRFASNAPLQLVISVAYDLPVNQSIRLSGAPDWARSMDAVYDIEATGAFPPGLSAQARNDRMRLMLQTLLADRFKLAIHRETKEMPVYALVVGKGGPKLQKADIEEKDCPDVSASLAPGAPLTACHSIAGGQGRGLHARAADMSDVVHYVENWTGRPLVDKTGIKGLFRLETKGWLPMQVGPPPAPGAKAEDGGDLADVPTLFTVFEQLGLRMESQRDKVDVYVVDHVEKPTEN
jgi:uncharacterized protein (TIGR03435 family)